MISPEELRGRHVLLASTVRKENSMKIWGFFFLNQSSTGFLLTTRASQVFLIPILYSISIRRNLVGDFSHSGSVNVTNMYHHLQRSEFLNLQVHYLRIWGKTIQNRYPNILENSAWQSNNFPPSLRNSRTPIVIPLENLQWYHPLHTLACTPNYLFRVNLK